MSSTTNRLDERVSAYVRALSLMRESEVLARLREETAPMEMAEMQISVEQGRLMALLVSMMDARRALDVGVFTGYSALCVAEQLPPDGRLVACDVSEEWAAIARGFWEEAGVADRIDLRIGAALDTLRSLPADPPIDLAFIDADKAGYIDYYEEILERLSPTGLILVDNVLWDGNVVDQSDQTESTEALRRFNRHVVDDERVRVALLPVGDGLSVIGRLGAH